MVLYSPERKEIRKKGRMKWVCRIRAFKKKKVA